MWWKFRFIFTASALKKKKTEQRTAEDVVQASTRMGNVCVCVWFSHSDQQVPAALCGKQRPSLFPHRSQSLASAVTHGVNNSSDGSTQRALFLQFASFNLPVSITVCFSSSCPFSEHAGLLSSLLVVFLLILKRAMLNFDDTQEDTTERYGSPRSSDFL